MARKYGVIASRATQRAVVRLIREHGVRGAAEQLGIGENATSRLGAGAPVIQATLSVAEGRLNINPMADSAV